MKMRWLVLAAALVLTGAVVLVRGASAPGWEGADIHVVDGYVLSTESRCGDDPPTSMCRAAASPALATLSDTDRAKVVGTSIAGWPTEYRDASGNRVMRKSAALAWFGAFVVDFSDRERRVIPVWCEPDTEYVTGEDGNSSLVTTPSCHLAVGGSEPTESQDPFVAR